MGLGAVDLARELEAAVAPGTLLSGERAAARTVAGVAPGFVAEPATVVGVSRVLALAAAHGLAVTPAGQGTRLGWGAPPRRLDILLSLARLDRVLAHEPEDLTLSVECGARLDALDGILRPYRQFLPLDPARSGTSTIGGLIATGAAGPYRARYGTMRDLLVGLTVVRANGTVVKGGGRVVKNVTGYDIPKLHVGALGTLGVVVEAHLRLHPRPAEERTWVFAFPSAEAALEAALEIRDTAVVLSRCQLLTAGALRAMGETAPPAAALALTIGSVSEAVRAQGAEGRRHLRSRGKRGHRGPGRRRVVASGQRSHLAGDHGHRPLPANRRSADRRGQGAPRRRGGHAGGRRGPRHGGRRDRRAPRGRDPVDARGVSSILARVRDGLAVVGGTCVVEHAPPEAMAGLDVWGDVGPAREAMRRLKRELDASSVLNPGRYVGGI